jgi:hypothetical protein
MSGCRYCPRPCATCGGEIPHRCYWCDGGEGPEDRWCWVDHRHGDDPPGTFPRRFKAIDLRYRYCSPTCAEAGRVRRRELTDARKGRQFCLTCNAEMRGMNHLRKFCSDACRQKAYRLNRSYAEAIGMAREAFGR